MSDQPLSRNTAVDVLTERLFQSALLHFRKNGFLNVELSAIANECGASLEELYSRFPRKESFIARLYEQLAFDLEARVAELPRGNISERFSYIMQSKLAAVCQHRELLQRLLPIMVDPESRLGVLGPHANRIRARVQAVFEAVVVGANNAPQITDESQRLTRFLYGAHLGLAFLAMQPNTDEALLAEGIELAAKLLEVMRTVQSRTASFIGGRLIRLAGMAPPQDLIEQADRLFSGLLHPATDRVHFSVAENILRDLFRFRRLLPGNESCAQEPCASCLTLHLPRVEAMVARQEPIRLVLPAFPAKSPNRRKVLGNLPDFGEELALRFLQQRCDAIAEIHSAGAELIICSDGRVFSDVVGVSDDDVTAYRARILEMIEQSGLTSLRVFDLDDINPHSNYDELRTWLVDNYAEPLEVVRERTVKHAHHLEMFNGIHRFMFEDLADREPDLSRTQCKNQSKTPAYQVIQRSNAWSRLVSVFFPDALRLSIHPQPAHCEKIGIQLTECDDPWLTPWHGVALLLSDRFVLTRRAQAEALKAKLIERNGQPSYYELVSQSTDTAH